MGISSALLQVGFTCTVRPHVSASCWVAGLVMSTNSLVQCPNKNNSPIDPKTLGPHSELRRWVPCHKRVGYPVTSRISSTCNKALEIPVMFVTEDPSPKLQMRHHVPEWTREPFLVRHKTMHQTAGQHPNMKHRQGAPQFRWAFGHCHRGILPYHSFHGCHSRLPLWGDKMHA